LSPANRIVFTEAIDALFAEYHSSTERMFEHLKARTARPAEMKEEAFHRILKARAFDVSRYLLPLATNTSLGQIVNARTLESQISRLLSDPHQEVRQLGERRPVQPGMSRARRSAPCNARSRPWTLS
jgi:thymidylate synthase ThyX